MRPVVDDNDLWLLSRIRSSWDWLPGGAKVDQDLRFVALVERQLRRGEEGNLSLLSCSRIPRIRTQLEFSTQTPRKKEHLERLLTTSADLRRRFLKHVSSAG